MKKILFSCLGMFMAMNMAFAGGLVHNTNQSAAWARMLVRDASTSIDAVYYNPAGLTKLSDGLHLSVSNQSIFQNRTLTNSYEQLNSAEFKGKVSAPFFPDLYAAYKTGKFAFSLGFTPIGGGGSASYDKGIPMIESGVAELASSLNDFGVTGYNLNANFKGSSVYFGIQGGISYAINDMISVYAGGRYVWAKNTYTGEMNNVNFETAGGDVPADDFMTGLATDAANGAAQYYGAASSADLASTSLDPIIAANAGGFTLAQLVAGGSLSQAQADQLNAGYTALGGNPTGLTAAQMQTGFDNFNATYTGLGDNYTQLSAEATGASIIFGGQEADVEQTGNGFTPIIGVNLALMEDKLNIGIKYEFKTEMELTNKTVEGKGFITGFTETAQPIEMFPDGEKKNADLPAQLTFGVNYKFTDDFSAQIGYHTYFDKGTGWTLTRENEAGDDVKYKVEDFIDNNFWELGLGFEYNISEQLLVSAGYLHAQTGVKPLIYNDDLSYSLSSNTFGLGGAYKINDMLTLQLGGYYTAYVPKTYEYDGGPATQKYEKTNLAFAIGLDFTFGGE